MELKQYFQIILKRWWIIPLALLCTMIPTYILVSQQPWVYQTEATFVIRPRTGLDINDEDTVKALDTLSRRVEINTTFAEVSSSNLIMQQAIERLGLTAKEKKGIKVSGRVIAGTNILEISVQGPVRELVHDFANAISLETVSYVSSLYDVFELEPVDDADFPTSPIGPNKTLEMALGVLFGFFLGIVLIFFAEYLSEPVHADTQLNIIDPQTGAYNETYLKLRLRQELSRVSHYSYAFSLAQIKVFQRGLVHDVAKPLPARQALRLILTSIEAYGRDENILAYTSNDIFALLLPHLSSDAGNEVLSALHTQIGLTPPEQIGNGQGGTIYCAIGFTTQTHHQYSTVNQVLSQTDQALQEAETAVYGKVHQYTLTTTTQPPQNSAIEPVGTLLTETGGNK